MSFFLLVAALLLSSSCITAPAAAVSDPSPPSYLPGPACSFPSSPSCPLLPPFSDSPPNATTLNLPLESSQSLLLFSTNFSSSSPLTLNITDETLGGCPPSPFLTLAPSPQLFNELIFNFSLPDSCADAKRSPLLAVCTDQSQEAQSQQPNKPYCTPSHSELEDTDRFNYVVSLRYDADSATVHVHAHVNYGGRFESTQTFVVNTTDHLQPCANDARAFRDNNIVLSGAYVTGGNATIIVTTSSSPPNESTLSDPSSPTNESILNDPPPSHKSNSKPKHIIVVVWVVVGVSILALLVGFTILALSIKKQYYGRPPLISSRPTCRRDTIPSSTTTRAPFPHHRLESQSSATPMMGLSPLSPLYNIDNFQLSGAASWLKQPNPR